MTVNQDHAGVPDARARVSGAARVTVLERAVAEQEEKIRALSEQLAAFGDALAAAARYAGVNCPPPPRRLRAVPGSGGVALDGHGSPR